MEVSAPFFVFSVKAKDTQMGETVVVEWQSDSECGKHIVDLATGLDFPIWTSPEAVRLPSKTVTYRYAIRSGDSYKYEGIDRTLELDPTKRVVQIKDECFGQQTRPCPSLAPLGSHLAASQELKDWLHQTLREELGDKQQQDMLMEFMRKESEKIKESIREVLYSDQTKPVLFEHIRDVLYSDETKPALREHIRELLDSDETKTFLLGKAPAVLDRDAPGPGLGAAAADEQPASENSYMPGWHWIYGQSRPAPPASDAQADLQHKQEEESVRAKQWLTRVLQDEESKALLVEKVMPKEFVQSTTDSMQQCMESLEGLKKVQEDALRRLEECEQSANSIEQCVKRLQSVETAQEDLKLATQTACISKCEDRFSAVDTAKEQDVQKLAQKLRDLDAKTERSRRSLQNELNDVRALFEDRSAQKSSAGSEPMTRETVQSASDLDSASTRCPTPPATPCPTPPEVPSRASAVPPPAAGLPSRQRLPSQLGQRQHHQATETTPPGVAPPTATATATTGASVGRVGAGTEGGTTAAAATTASQPYFREPPHPTNHEARSITLAIEQRICDELARVGSTVSERRAFVKQLNLQAHPDKGGQSEAMQWLQAWRSQHERWFVNGRHQQ